MSSSLRLCFFSVAKSMVMALTYYFALSVVKVLLVGAIESVTSFLHHSCRVFTVFCVTTT